MEPLSIFVSHGSKYADIAVSLKRSLLRVPSSRTLSVKLSEDMPAGRWIGFTLVWIALVIFTAEATHYHRRRQLRLTAVASAA